MLQFTNPDTVKHFECLVEVDRLVHKAGLYSGLLSNITPEMAKAITAGESNLVKEKEEAPHTEGS